MALSYAHEQLRIFGVAEECCSSRKPGDAKATLAVLDWPHDSPSQEEPRMRVLFATVRREWLAKPSPSDIIPDHVELATKHGSRS